MVMHWAMAYYTHMQTLCIPGRQPELAAAELEALFDASKVQVLADGILALNVPIQDVPFDRLGTIIKAGRLLTTLPTTYWPDVLRYLIETAPEHAAYVPDGKLTIGVSVYGLSVRPAKMREDLIKIKKAIQATGRSVRIVPNKEPTLSSPQVIHNNLTGSNGWELLCIRRGNETILAQSVHIQDIEAYAARDQARPMRDAKVGMLPPKLAQLLVNLATEGHADRIVLDPFCGTGVVLQEALLMGYDVAGSDLEPRMIDYTTGNLEWLRREWPAAQGDQRIVQLAVGDAQTHRWLFDVKPRYPIAVAAETYLGPPLFTIPPPAKLQTIITEVNTLHRHVLQNLASQLASGSRLCLAVPAWQLPDGRLKHLPILDELSKLGYNHVSFRRVSTRELAYRRPGQSVAREILTLIRK